MSTDLAEFNPSQDYVSMLKHLCDKERHTFTYEECKASDDFSFGCVAKVAGISYDVGVGSTKKEAKKQASWIALKALRQATTGALPPSFASGRSPKRDVIAECRERNKDAITTLKEVSDQRRQQPCYVETENPPSSNFKFSCEVFVGNVRGNGDGHTKKEAKAEAAEDALRTILDGDRESRSDLPGGSGKRRHRSSPPRNKPTYLMGSNPLTKTSSDSSIPVSPASEYLAQPYFPELPKRNDVEELQKFCAENGLDVEFVPSHIEGQFGSQAIIKFPVGIRDSKPEAESQAARKALDLFRKPSSNLTGAVIEGVRDAIGLPQRHAAPPVLKKSPRSLSSGAASGVPRARPTYTDTQQDGDVLTCKSFKLDQVVGKESSIMEFKRGFPDRLILKTVGSFLNQKEGGVMFLGVDEVPCGGNVMQGKVFGVIRLDVGDNNKQGNDDWLSDRTSQALAKILGRGNKRADRDNRVNHEIIPVIDGYGRPVERKDNSGKEQEVLVVRIIVRRDDEVHFPTWKIYEEKGGKPVYPKRTGLHIEKLSPEDVKLIVATEWEKSRSETKRALDITLEAADKKHKIIADEKQDLESYMNDLAQEQTENETDAKAKKGKGKKGTGKEASEKKEEQRD